MSHESAGPNLGKLRSLIHYICYKCTDPDMLGATKLNKVLWYSDAVSFAKEGTPITGETYIKRQYGPVPQHMQAMLNELVGEGAIVIRENDEFHGYHKREYISLREPDLSAFSAKEISTVDSVIDVVCHQHTARSISLATHDRAWELADIGEEIPLHAVLASELGEVTEDDVQWARKALAKAG